MAYSQKFEAVFSDLAKEYKLPFIPFFLSPVIEKLELLQEDELHPTAEAQPLLLATVLPVVNDALK
jgi:acyl-CoA thioesterase-1